MLSATDENAPRVSVVISLHNRAARIGSAIRSVLSQSVQDFEIIVVDDGSTDDGGRQVLGFDDNRIRYVVQANAGANVARNKGIDLARGCFVALLDSDDRMCPGHLERALAILAEAPETIVFARIVVDRGSDLTFLKPPRAPRPDEAMSEYLMTDRGFAQTSTVVLATATARLVRYLDWLRWGQDTDFAVRLAAAGYRFRMINEPGAIWHDVADPARVSAAPQASHLLQWLEFIRPYVSTRAWYGYRGWHVSRALARQRGGKRTALGYFAAALVRRCYSPALAARIALQIMLAGRRYRALADLNLWLSPSSRRRRISAKVAS
jgi:glycosyltransferase involved in cell wall biosynthesis